jgi:hypothetical protein
MRKKRTEETPRSRSQYRAPIRSTAGAGEAPLIETKYANIYPADIERVEENYIQSLPDPDSIYNINAFIGLLFRLNREVVAPALKRPGDIKTGAKGYDINAMNEIFYHVFIPLISKYRITPTIGMFMYLIGIDSSVVDRWKKPSNTSIDIDNIDIYDSSNNCNVSSKSNIDKYSIYRKWNSYIEQWILGNVVNTNSIGGMFALKAVYGYSDAQTIRIEAQETRPAINAAQLDRIAGEAATPPQIEQN